MSTVDYKCRADWQKELQKTKTKNQQKEKQCCLKLQKLFCCWKDVNEVCICDVAGKEQAFTSTKTLLWLFLFGHLRWNIFHLKCRQIHEKKSSFCLKKWPWVTALKEGFLKLAPTAQTKWFSVFFKCDLIELKVCRSINCLNDENKKINHGFVFLWGHFSSTAQVLLLASLYVSFLLILSHFWTYKSTKKNEKVEGNVF